jgi:UDP-N-acetyl-D-mannosaminuronic acid dehydrogenase
LVILESTSPPGTCREVLAPILEESGLTAGTDFYLAYCPERVLPGRTVKELIENDRVIGGINRASAEAAARVYRVFVEGSIHLTDCTTAEMVKLMENTYRDVNIALANELALVCERLGIDVWEAIRLANLHPRVNLHLPGPGVGGHCLAVDPWFIVEKCPEEARLIALGRQTNDAMPEHVVARVKQILSEDKPPGSVGLPQVAEVRSAAGTGQTTVSGSASLAISPKFKENQVSTGSGKPDWKVAVLGVAYKGNIDDARETPALRVLDLFSRERISFGVYDPHVRDFPYELAPLKDVLAGADCLLVLADHDEFRFLHPLEVGKLMRRRVAFDTKNVLDRQLWRQSGFQLYCLGSGM